VLVVCRLADAYYGYFTAQRVFRHSLLSPKPI
jgi:hypothetical protein